VVVLACLLAAGAAGCGSSGKPSPPKPGSAKALLPVRLCLRHNGYAVTPESAKIRRTAPKSFEFLAIWGLLNPARVALTVTFSKSEAGATRAQAWLRKENAKVGRGVVHAPVARFGKVDVLWTAQPSAADMKGIYGCVRGTRAP
jgi:hypothetical protein